MKKLYLIIVLVIGSLSLNAQSFSLSNLFYTGNPMYFSEGHITLANNSSTPKDVYVMRTENNLFPGHDSYFCWVQCYASTVDVSPDFMTIQPGTTTDIFRGDLEANAISGTSVVSYCFYDGNNPSDSVCVQFVYPTFVGLAEVGAGKNYISKAYPNPASDVANFYVNVDKSNKSAQLKFFNMLGSQVKEVNLNNAKNSVKVNISDLKAGIYFYSLWVDGKSSSTGKLMVTKN